MNTQLSQILKALKRGKRLTPLYVLDNFGCMRLSARIYDLREMGYEIESKLVERNGKRFAEYRMVR